MCKPIRIQRSRQVKQVSPNGLRIIACSRPSKWGNPFMTIGGAVFVRNEVAHTLDQISLPRGMKPKEDEIMSLKIGHFILSSREEVVRVYVQPAWLSDEDALLIAMGKKQIEDAMIKQPLPSFNFPAPQKEFESQKEAILPTGNFVTKKELIELRSDFFKSLQQVVTDVKNFVEKNQTGNITQEIDYDNIVSLVLQKLPPPSIAAAGQPVNTDALIAQILKKIPPNQGSVTYTVAPLEKIKKEFLNEAKAKIIDDVTQLTSEAKKMMKYLESKERGCGISEIVEKCFLLKINGGQSKRVNDFGAELISIGASRKDTAGKYYPELKIRIKVLIGNHEATEQEIETVYNHILMEVIK